MPYATNIPHLLMVTMSCPAQVPCHQPQKGNDPPTSSTRGDGNDVARQRMCHFI
ncbi:hypothetical protein K443DRAFT_6811 [Laccaria amethystina LaAM-08-1]|uniref:Uncharacterized protein n=1 Tax=Laccaria amethystina LaAM-08-1 TaxID=1095629 RepID=A0A0C9WS40_9AGAR|nr:hypothetical protein K443DRAFT_6811 [Laccaria amethystina LaAM-08-1]